MCKAGVLSGVFVLTTLFSGPVVAQNAPAAPQTLPVPAGGGGGGLGCDMSGEWSARSREDWEDRTLLGHLAASTTRIGLGVGVVNPYTRHPTLIAMGAATLDVLSGGRFVRHGHW